MSFIILLVALLLIGTSFVIGWWAKRKVTSAEAYYGGTKTFGPLAISLSTMAAVASAFALVGIPGLVYKTGNTLLLWMFASAAFGFGYLVIGKKVRAMAEIGPIASLGDISDLRFNHHRGIKALVSLVMFIGCVAYLASQIKACSTLFAHLLDWNEYVTGFTIFGILTAYTILSGEVGGILTQAFQGFIMVIAGVIIIIAFLVMTGGSLEPVTDTLTSGATVAGNGVEKTFDPNFLNAWGSLPGSYALAWILVPTLGIIGQPQVLTRMFALKDPHEMPKLSLYVTIAHMIMALMVMIVGYASLYLVGRGLVTPLEDPDKSIYVLADYLGAYAQLFVYAAVLAAAMSTSSLFLSLSGGIISRDLPKALGFRFDATRQLFFSQVAILLLGIAAIIFALASGDMVAILGTFGYGTLMSATFPVFVIGLLWDRASSEGVFAGLVVALVLNIGALLLNNAGFQWPGNLPWYVNVIAASIVVTIFVSLFTKGATGGALDKRVKAVIEL